MISQNSFHPMRGHVDDGVIVRMNNGELLTIKSTMAGWIIVDQTGKPIAAPSQSANAIASNIQSR